MIEVPVYLAVTQWVILFSLALLLLILYRQFARQLGLGAAAPAHGLEAGSAAPAFSYGRPGRPRDAERFEPASGRPSLLLFGDPSCDACERALRDLEVAVRSPLLDGVDVLVVTSEPDTHLAASETFRATSLRVGRTEDGVGHRYQVDVTPFVYGIGPDGRVRTHRIPGSVGDFELTARGAVHDDAAPDAVAAGAGPHNIQEA
jgi:hypothetical protein